MEPIIKWPGGKSNEVNYVEEIMPKEFDRYIEPFFGGGAVFFHLEPKKAIINDVCKELIDFYKFIKGDLDRGEFEKELMDYAKKWNKINHYNGKFENFLLKLYDKFKLNLIAEKEMETEILAFFSDQNELFNGLFSKDFCVDRERLETELKKGIISKLKRIKKIDPNNKFTKIEMKNHIETGFRSGFYMHFRNIMNDSKFDKINISDSKKIANYYFIREFCYGSMFRFNKKGVFNIPYGGINYNKKNFEEKINRVLSPKVKNIFQNTIIENLDFEDFFKKYQFKENDFIFLDPPYDTEFSGYEETPFTKKDQERLAKCLYNLKAKFILIIKNTDFILNLYQNKHNIKMDSFDKTYTYNVRGRNIRDVQHLIIHNLSNTQKKLIEKWVQTV